MPFHVYLPPLTIAPLSSIESSHDVYFYPVPTLPKATNDHGAAPSLSLAPERPRRRRSSSPPPATTTPPPASDRRRSKRLRASSMSTRLPPDMRGADPDTSASTRGGVTQPEISESYSHLSSLNSVSLSARSAPSQSLANIPTWTVPLHKILQLSALLAPSDGRSRRSRGHAEESGARKRISVMCCVMSVDAPVRRQRRKPGPRGRMGDVWIATWRVSAPGTRGDSLSDPVSCDVKLWDECARDWGGRVRKGDVVLLEGKSSDSSTRSQSRRRVSPSLDRRQPGTTACLLAFELSSSTCRSLPYSSSARGDPA